MKKEMLHQWLLLYGTPISEIREENVVVSDVEEESEDEAGAGKVQLGTSSLIVKMELKKPIPEFLPIDGKKVRIHYGGIAKQCLNCYGYNHKKSECKDQKCTWLEYVTGFIQSHNLEENMYGKWARISREKNSENTLTEQSTNQKRNKETCKVSNQIEPNVQPEQQNQTNTITGVVNNAVNDIINRLKAITNEPTPPQPTNKMRGRGRPPK